jgi:hypothetical protein
MYLVFALMQNSIFLQFLDIPNCLQFREALEHDKGDCYAGIEVSAGCRTEEYDREQNTECIAEANLE